METWSKLKLLLKGEIKEDTNMYASERNKNIYYLLASVSNVFLTGALKHQTWGTNNMLNSHALLLHWLHFRKLRYIIFKIEQNATKIVKNMHTKVRFLDTITKGWTTQKDYLAL